MKRNTFPTCGGVHTYPDDRGIPVAARAIPLMPRDGPDLAGATSRAFFDSCTDQRVQVCPSNHDPSGLVENGIGHCPPIVQSVHRRPSQCLTEFNDQNGAAPRLSKRADEKLRMMRLPAT